MNNLEKLRELKELVAFRRQVLKLDEATLAQRIRSAEEGPEWRPTPQGQYDWSGWYKKSQAAEEPRTAPSEPHFSNRELDELREALWLAIGQGWQKDSNYEVVQSIISKLRMRGK